MDNLDKLELMKLKADEQRQRNREAFPECTQIIDKLRAAGFKIERVEYLRENGKEFRG
jgi:hypothetical protein